MARIKKKPFLISLGCVLLLMIGAGILAPGAMIYRPVPFQQADFDNAVKWVVAHRTQNSDVIPLPDAFQGLSKTGKVYLTGNDIFIPSWIGRKMLFPKQLYDDADCCEGYLYVGSQIAYDKDAGDIPQVTINVPTQNGRVGKSAMFVPDSPLANHWYFVCDPDDYD